MAAHPARFEADSLTGFVAAPGDGMGPNPSQTLRVVRSADRFVIAVATSVATGAAMGVFAEALPRAAGGALTPPLALQYVVPASGDVHTMTRPRAIVRTGPDTYVVVGAGTLLVAATATVVSGPAVARIIVGAGAAVDCAPCGSPCNPPILCGECWVSVGNAVQDEAEVYTDVCIAVDAPPPGCGSAPLASCTPCGRRGGPPATPPSPPDLLVCGGNGDAALLRRLDGVTLDAVEFLTIDMTGSPAASGAAATCGVSLAAVPGLIAVVVHVTPTIGTTLQTLVWPVLPQPALTQLTPWTATAFNDPTTGLLPLTLNTTSVIGLRALANVATGTVYVAALAAFDTALGTPPHGAQVFRFLRDTTPDPAFGIQGVQTWFDCAGGSARPNDAALLLNAPRGSDGVVVVGNAFSEEVAPGGPWTYAPPFPASVANTDYLAVGTPGPADPAPRPFAVSIVRAPGGGAVVTSLMNGLQGATCPDLWLAAISPLVPGGAQIQAFGDACFHPGAPSQPAGLLALDMQVGRQNNGVRVLNCGPAGLVGAGSGLCGCCPAPCCAVTYVGARSAAPTILNVQGPIVVGTYSPGDGMPASGPCACVVEQPGMIRFDTATGTFQGFNGTAWMTFAQDPLP